MQHIATPKPRNMSQVLSTRGASEEGGGREGRLLRSCFAAALAFNAFNGNLQGRSHDDVADICLRYTFLYMH